MRHNFQSHLSPEHAPRCSPILRQYEIKEKLGKGATSEVYRVVSRQTQESFALKVVSKVRAEAAGLTPQLFLERNILANIRSPDVIRLHQTFQDDCFVYFLLEYAPQRSLLRLWRMLGGILPENDTKKIVGWLVRVVFELHQFGVIHRDIKPENILMGPNGKLKLSDFGAAWVFPVAGNERLMTAIGNTHSAGRHKDSVSTKASDSFGESQLRADPRTQRISLFGASECDLQQVMLDCSALHPTVGTLLYLSPESLNGEVTDPSVDIWSVGVLAHQLLTGEFPFSGKDDLHLGASISQGNLVLSETLFPAAADFFKAIFRKDRRLRLGCSAESPQDNLQQLLQHPFLRQPWNAPSNFGQIDLSDTVLFSCEAEWVWAKIFRSDVTLQLRLKRIDVLDHRNLVVRTIDLPSLTQVEGLHSGRLRLAGPEGSWEFRLRGCWPRKWVEAIARQLAAC